MKHLSPVVLMFFVVFSLHAQTIRNSDLLSVNADNKNLTAVLQDLSHQSGRNISFGNGLTDIVKVSGNYKNERLEHIIYNLTKETQVTATFGSDSSIIIIPRQTIYTGDLTIVIRDKKTKEPLHLASVTMTDLNTGSTSDSLGITEFKKIPAGLYKFSIQYLGYRHLTGLTCIRTEKQNIILAELDPENIDIPEIVVLNPVTSVSDLGIGYKNLTLPELKNRFSYTPDLFKSAELIPGILYDEFSSGLSIRGGNPFETKIILDELELYSAYHFDDFFKISSVLNPESISGFEINRGGFNSAYGNSISGVVKLTTIKSDQTKWSLNLSNSTVSGLYTTGTEHNNGLLSYRAGNESLLYRDTYDSGNLEPLFGDVYGKWENHPNNQLKLSAHYLLTMDNVSVERTDKLWTPNLESRKTGNFVWFNSRYITNNELIIKSSVFWQNIFKSASFDFSNSIYENNTDKRNYNIAGLNGSVSWLNNSGEQTELGFQIHHFNLDYRYLEYRFDKNSTFDSSNVRLNKKRTLYSLYFNRDIFLADKINVQIGIRLEKMNYSRYALLDPRLAVNYFVTDNFHVSFAAGLYSQHSAPDDIELTLNETADLPPDRSVNYTFEFEHNIPFNIRYTASVYLKDYVQLSDDSEYNFNERYTIFNPQRIPNSITSGESKGFDFFVRQDQPIFSWLISYSANRSTLTDGLKDYRRSFEVKHRFDFGIGINLTDNWSFSLLFRNQSGSPYTSQLNPVLYPVIYPRTLIVDYGERNDLTSDPVESLKIKITREFRISDVGGSFYIGIHNVLGYRPTYQKHQIPKNQSQIIIPVNKKYYTPRSIFFGLQFSTFRK